MRLFQWIEVFPATTPSIISATPVMAYDTSRDKAVLYGIKAGPTGHTFEYYSGDWHDVTSGTQPVLTEMSMAYDVANGYCLMVGHAGFGVTETWSWNGTTWTKHVTGTTVFLGAALCYDTVNDQVLMTGKQYKAGIDSAGYSTTQKLYYWTGSDWTLITPATTYPYRSEAPSFGWDELRGYAVMRGGDYAPSADLDDTWKWDGSDWTDVTPGSPPLGFGYYQNAVFDHLSQTIVVVGDAGNDIETTPATMASWDGSAWNNSTHLPPPIWSTGSQLATCWNVTYGKVMGFSYHQYAGGTFHTWFLYWVSDFIPQQYRRLTR